MDILQFLSSVNKISLVAFIATFAFLFYEVHLLRKEKQKKNVPAIPQFKENVNVVVAQSKVIVTAKKEEIKKFKNIQIVIFITFFLIIVAGSSVFLLKSKSTISTQASTLNSIPITQLVSSHGIKFFSNSFEPMSDNQVSGLQSGDSLIIGIETIEGVDIDYARIKVNKIGWVPENITNKFDNKNKVYFKNYTIATEESQLKVDAELHSKKDGWLGE